MAWGCAAAFRTFGADLAVTYLNDKVKKQVDPLACALQFPIVMPLGVRVPGQMEAVFDRLAKEWGKLDFVVHSIAFAPQEALHGRVVDISLEGLSDRDAGLMLDNPSNGPAGRAVDEEGRHSHYDDVLW